MPRSYWLDLFTGKTWREFLAAGSQVSGFRESQWKPAQRIQVGDYLLCYLTGISRWIGILETTGPAFKDSAKIWEDEPFPCRVRVKPLVMLTPETAVPIHNMRGELTIFRGGKSKIYWTGFLRGSPRRWSTQDGEAIVRAVFDAQKSPVARPVDKTKLEKRPRAVKSKIGPVTIPEPEPVPPAAVEAEEAATEHTEIQWLLLNLGSQMGLRIWAARNDQNRIYKGRHFSDLPGFLTQLPRQFDDVSNRIIENIDVLWLEDTNFIAAFEIESTTSIYSGLLRMSDLVTLQPNLNLPLFVVAPDDRRDKVIKEVNRPTFSRLKKPLRSICRFIPFSTFRSRVHGLGNTARYLRPDFLEDISETCEAAKP